VRRFALLFADKRRKLIYNYRCENLLVFSTYGLVTRNTAYEARMRRFGRFCAFLLQHLYCSTFLTAVIHNF